MKALRISIVAIAMLACAPAFPQLAPFHTYTTRDGLVSNYVACLCQDSQGYLWIGTTEGISRYDGYSFRNFTPAEGLPFPYVTSIIEDRRTPGALWVGTNGKGVCTLVNGKFTAVPARDCRANLNILSFLQDRAGTVWCGGDHGIYIIRNDTLSPLQTSVPIDYISAMAETPDGVLWIGCKQGLYGYSATTGALIRVPGIRQGVSALCIDSSGALWAGIEDGAVAVVRGGKIIEMHKMPNAAPAFLFCDAGNMIWTCTYAGVYRFSASSPARPLAAFTSANGLSENAIVAGLVDKEHNLWFGGMFKGISRLSERGVVRFRSDSLVMVYNNAVAAADANGHIWLAAQKALWELWRDSAGRYRRAVHRLPAQEGNLMITFDAQERLWVGSTANKIACYRIGARSRGASELQCVRGVSLSPFSKFPLLCFIVDNDGLLWCSMSDSGIIVLDPLSKHVFVRRLTAAGGLPDNSIRALFQDHAGNIWMGGYGLGLAELDYARRLRGAPRSVVPRGGLPDNGIRSIAEDPQGRLWVGTRYGGIAVLEHDSARTFSVKEGLSSNAVWAIAACRDGSMMLGTQMGLDYGDSRHIKPFRHNPDFTGSAVFGCGSAAGIEWYVTTDGVTLLDESAGIGDTAAPPVRITSFEVNGVSLPPAAEAHLAHYQNNCVIGYAGMSLKDARALRYEYRLLPSDTRWHEPAAIREVSYAALKPGSYIFQVRAIGPNGARSAAPATAAFTIAPPFWLRWWFITAEIAAVAAAAWLAVRARIRRLLEIERIRAHIATDLHDDIGSGLTRIAIVSDVANTQLRALRNAGAEELPYAAASVQKIGNIARELVDAMSDVVWAINPKQDSMRMLVARLRTFAFELSEAKNIALVFDAEEGIEQLKLGAEIKRGLLLIVKEALTNVVKHAACVTVRVALEHSGGAVRVSVEDDGTGFDASRRAAGNGMANMRKRAESLGGTFSVESSLGGGTRIRAEIPLSGKTAHLFS